MNLDRVIEIGLAVGSAAIGYLTYRAAGRAAEQQRAGQAAAVDAGAYARARSIYEGALDTLREELGACRAELDSTRKETRKEITGLRADNRGLHAELAAVRAELGALRAGPG